MKPYQHALIAERRYGGSWQDWIEVPNWLDQTKMAYASVQHRVFLHTELGRDLAVEYLGEYTVSVKNGYVEVPTYDLATDHMIEDLGEVVSLKEWLKHLDDLTLRGIRTRTLPFRSSFQKRLADDPIGTLVETYGGDSQDYQEFLELFDKPALYTDDDPKALWIMHSTFGPFLAEQLFGPVWTLPSGRHVSIRGVAEDLVQARTGFMAPISQVAGSIRIRKWMAGTNVGKALKARKAAEAAGVKSN